MVILENREFAFGLPGYPKRVGQCSLQGTVLNGMDDSMFLLLHCELWLLFVFTTDFITLLERDM